MIINTFFDRQS